MVQFDRHQQNQENQYLFPYHYSDFVSDEYKHIMMIEYLGHIELIKNLLKPFRGQKVLDVGCGDGRVCWELRKENLNLTGVDYSEKAIGFAKILNEGVPFFVQDIKTLNLPERFDAMVFMETLEHIPPSEIPAVMRSLHRNLKSDGKLIITVPSKNAPLDPKHFQHFTADTLATSVKPYFQIKLIKGRQRKNGASTLLKYMKYVAVVLYPLRKRIPAIISFYKFLGRFYIKYCNQGSAKSCLGIIAVCEKSKFNK